MHQQFRPPPRVSSPASSPQTNPTRTNNPRDALGIASRTRSGSEGVGLDGTALAESGGSGSGPSRESIKKLDQIIQNFHLKAAVLILQSRINVTPVGGGRSSSSRKNKWFQIETDEIDDFRDELRVWKTCGGFENRPPPMIIETYLDASRLSNSQSLVIVDDNGKRWDVLEALNSVSSGSSADGSPRGNERRGGEVVLERWRLELKSLPSDDIEDFGAILPTIYKKSIVFFRSLFTATRVIPCWKYSRQALAKGIHPALEVKCRILMSEPDHRALDPLTQPLFDGRDVVTDYMFGDLEVPVGRFSASVTYRNDCSFRVDDAESLLSSRFMGVDENFFKPSIPQNRGHARTESYGGEIGSLPSHRHARGAQEPAQTYGSLSTFHGAGALGTSPISAIRAVKPIGSDTSSPSGSIAASLEPDPPHSLPIRGHSSAARPSIRGTDSMGRRPSVSFQPFKAGSLSGSPRIPDFDSPSSPQSLTRPSGLSGSNQARNRSSLTAGMAASLRGGPSVAEPPVSSSPRPAGTSRYSSSFSHRRGRPSFGGQSRAGDDDQGSSGRQSLSSSVQPGSGLLAEAGTGGSSGSFQTDDDNISLFLKELDSKRTLQSFEPNKKGESSAAKKTAAQLSRFHLMRESNNVLTESITSSMQLHRSSSSSSKQLGNVPSMVNPSSMSASSSPGKPLSPHTPHTPAIPSRLSENSIINYHGQPEAPRHAGGNTASNTTEEAIMEDVPVSQDGTSAIDIPLPLSPRLPHTSGTRRSSSVAQQHRALIDDEDADVQRSISLGGNDGDGPSLSALLALHRPAGPDRSGPSSLQPPAAIRASGEPSPKARDDRASPGGFLAPGPSYRYRYIGRGRGTPPGSSRGSFSAARFSGVLPRDGAHNDNEDDDPLVFPISELERGEGSRRSLEEARGGSSGAASGSGHWEEYEPRGTSRRGWQ